MKAVIFDMDGTLVDSVDLHAEAWQQAFEHFGHDIPFQSIRSQIGKGGDQLMPVFLSKEEIESKGKQIEKYRSEYFKREFMPKVKPFAQVRELFERLIEDGWKLALASSAKEDELQIYKDICHISDLLDTETSSDDAEESKPHPDIFEAAMKRLGDISPKDCLVVGDSPYDAEAAGKAGIRSIGFLSGGFPEDDLRRAGYESIYEGTHDLFAQYDESCFRQESPRLSQSSSSPHPI
jgi:HAD superfamily hydrolase (TIGR01509 family)